jgi:hypothetical protein
MYLLHAKANDRHRETAHVSYTPLLPLPCVALLAGQALSSALFITSNVNRIAHFARTSSLVDPRQA